MDGEARRYSAGGEPRFTGTTGGAETEARSDFAEAVLRGFARRPRSLPCRFLYDARGAELFEEITKLPEYYPTRTETALLQAYAAEIAAQATGIRVLIEFGSGSSRKTDLLLRALTGLEAYIPIDIAAESLHDAAKRLSRRHKRLAIMPLVADFTSSPTLPAETPGGPMLGVFFGSTIGNFTHEEARRFLTNAGRMLGPSGLLLIGVDLKKSERRLVEAYNDASGITAAFNLNLLTRINRELDGTFDITRFSHDAVWNAAKGRIEMYLVSEAEQIAHVNGRGFSFGKSERIHTENAHKYSVPEFQSLAAAAGWRPVDVWSDAERLFSLHLLRR